MNCSSFSDNFSGYKGARDSRRSVERSSDWETKDSDFEKSPNDCNSVDKPTKPTFSESERTRLELNFWMVCPNLTTEDGDNVCGRGERRRAWLVSTDFERK